MRVEGVLSKWNDERGFGFIAPDRGGPEVFVHISAFPRNGQRPRPGERLSFEIETDRLGKPRAVRVARPGRQGVSRGGPGASRRPDRKRAPFGLTKNPRVSAPLRAATSADSSNFPR